MHGDWVHGRRVQVLARHLAEFVPEDADVVDVGCGDGQIASLVARARPDVRVRGTDIAARPDAHIPVLEYDGATLPFGDRGVDVVMCVDVLHHADDPMALLSEVARVADRAIVMKDVMTLGPLSDQTLRAMDWVGNKRHGVPLPYTFWSQAQWRRAFAELGLKAELERRRFGIYPRPLGVLFERRMHFLVRLTPTS